MREIRKDQTYKDRERACGRAAYAENRTEIRAKKREYMREWRRRKREVPK